MGLLRWAVITDNMSERELVNEESEDDEGYSSIAGYDPNKYPSKTKLRRNKIREEDLRIVEGDTKEMLTEKFLLLRDAYDKLKDENTLLEYENESLKDYQDEREEEMKLQRTDLTHLTESLKVLQKEREGDRIIISKQQEIIENYAKDLKVPED